MQKRFIIFIAAVLLVAAGAGSYVLLRKPKVDAPSNTTYAALGDSVAAGVGLPESSLATHQDTLCRRSASAYPVLVAANTKLDLNDLACSGAKINDLIGSQKIKSDFVPSQIDRAFQNNTPKLITMSIGANDIQFTSVLAQCYAGDCSSAKNTIAVQQRIAKVGSDLQTVLQQIKNRSHGQTKVVVVGYYQLVSASCTKFAPRITTDEAAWIDARTAELNDTLQKTILAANDHFAAVDFSGHDLCSADSWVQNLSTTGALHPTSQGQAAIAASVEKQLN